MDLLGDPTVADHPYSLPHLYDVAFSFRDYARAVDFLLAAARRASGRDPASVVELGCGPGQYCREFARRGLPAFGVDRAPEMAAYAARLAAGENLPCAILEADIRRFTLPHPVDLACCMMATFHLLLTDDELAAHLDAVADNLNPGGIYIIELSHPRDFLTRQRSTRNLWTVDRDGLSVTVDWGSDAVTDPLSEITTGTVSYAVSGPSGAARHESREQWREISAGLIRALIRLSGRFAIVAWYGDLDTGVPFDAGDRAWRMILVLRLC